MPDLSIVIPAYREEDRLPPSMEKIQAWVAASGLEVEVVLVAEDSPDRTREVARNLAARYPNVVLLENEQRMGKGFTVIRGVLAATAPLVLFTDTDLSVPIAEASTLIDRRESSGADAVIGRRVQVTKQPLKRRIMGHGFRVLTRIIAGVPFHDTQCGFKLFTREFVQDVFPRVETIGWGFGFDVDTLAIGRARGYDIRDVRVEWHDDERSTVDPLRDAWDMFRQLFRTRAAARQAGREGRIR